MMNTQQHTPAGFQAFAMPSAMPTAMDGRGQELYEQLFALAQTLGEAYTEAAQRIGGAYMEGFQKLAVGAGGLDNLHMSFYGGKMDIGNDGVWDVWKLEAENMVWYFRGAPHVHTWVHIREG